MYLFICSINIDQRSQTVFIMKLGGNDLSDEVPESEYEDRHRLGSYVLQSAIYNPGYKTMRLSGIQQSLL